MKAKPLPGRLSERSIRATLNAIKRKLRDPGINTKQMLQLLGHQERLQRELASVAAGKAKQIEADKIRAQLAELEATAQAKS
jgi:hypothetical protein